MYVVKTDLTKIVQDNEVYIGSDGTKYSKNWPKSKIIDLAEVIETAPPSGSDIVVEDFYIDETYTQIWNTRSKTTEEVSSELISEAKMALEETDMVAIRCSKAGLAFPSEWLAYVLSLRDVVNKISTTIPTQPEYPTGS